MADALDALAQDINLLGGCLVEFAEGGRFVLLELGSELVDTLHLLVDLDDVVFDMAIDIEHIAHALCLDVLGSIRVS